MRNVIRYTAVATAGLLMATNPSDAASKGSAREAAIRKCNARVLKQVPRVGDSASNQQQRTALWKDCMVASGQRP
jgi:hypothetical protein